MFKRIHPVLHSTRAYYASLDQKARLILIALLASLVLVIIYAATNSTATPDNTNVVTVTRGTLVEQALAVGNITPQHSITVTSTIPGTVAMLMHDEGDAVKKGEVLLEIAPNPTPQDLDAAERDLQEKQIAEQTTQAHLKRYQVLLQKDFVSQDDYEQALQTAQTATLDRQLSQEKLALLQQGKTTIGNKIIQNVVTSPIDGFILARNVDVGDPVVPQTDSQAGNTLFTIANMHDLIFKGQVNEIDVGKIHAGMPAAITLSALPDQTIKGTLYKIALQSAQANNAQTNNANPSNTNASSTTNTPFNVGFEVTINNLQIPAGVQLRAGYSANAEIVIQHAINVLQIPERVLDFQGNKTFVWLPGKYGRPPQEKEIKTGISDGINVEVISGLKAGQAVLDGNPNQPKPDNS